MKDRLMKRFGLLKGESGFALVLSIMVMAGMSVLAIAIFTTTTTDMYIARNEVEAKKAFYLAEAGIEEAMGRLDLSSSSPSGWAAGETSTNKSDRIADPAAYKASPDYTGNTFTSADLALSGIYGSYSVTINYATEAGATWCNDENSDGVYDDCDDDIVLYGQDFGFSGLGVPSSGFVPVYEVTSVGTTGLGTTATVRAYLTSSTLNTLPPDDSILFVEGGIKIGPAAGAAVVGKVISTEGSGAIFGNISSAGYEDISASFDPDGEWELNDMDDYLGVNINSISGYADHTYSQTGTNMVNYNVDDGDWGTMCSQGTVDALSAHVCDNEADLVYINNAGAGMANIASNARGRGILIVTGNLSIAGNFVWEGMIYVMGRMEVNGTTTLYGTFMVDGDEIEGVNPSPGPPAVYDTHVNGALTIRGSQEVAASVADVVGVPRVVRWLRL